MFLIRYEWFIYNKQYWLPVFVNFYFLRLWVHILPYLKYNDFNNIYYINNKYNSTLHNKTCYNHKYDITIHVFSVLLYISGFFYDIL